MITVGAIFGKTPEISIWGQQSSRNNVIDNASHLPTDCQPGKFDRKTGKWLHDEKSKKIKWAAELGNTTYGSPVCAGGKVFCTTNNAAGYDPNYPKSVDLGCLLAFDTKNGNFLWQYSVEKLENDGIDWPEQGICSNPVVENSKLWIVNNRGEVVCLDTEKGNVIWKFDMITELGVVPRQMTCCSPLIVGTYVITGTSNGKDAQGKTVPHPNAPDIIALDKVTGKLLWQDTPCGKNILDGQWASPAVGTKEEQSYLYYPGGDGWLYAYKIKEQSHPPLVFQWKFNCNPEGTVWRGGQGTKNILVATPVISRDKIYIATGQSPESGDGTAVLWALEQGEKANAAWKYDGKVSGSNDFEEQFHRTIGAVVEYENLLLVGDFAGLVHCLNAETGEFHWCYDMMAPIWGSPLAADGKFYLGDSDGDLVIFQASDKLSVLAEVNWGDAIYTVPTFYGTILYVTTNHYLFALGEE
ncbi:MAG: PQQ-binding-like beta-propeller repeat protein [Planctomycetaceae bacterium]|jgi:outer membrane protein assembly factor BamB|nr:PQQ-binding-like beta-propeller repeat protein [Planctomycetaceae bacterium]